jgi:CubicO group peptidase (beta-lactamase class C family)
MKTPALIFFLCSLTALASDRFDTDRTNARAAGMDAERLARIPARMKEFVDAGRAAGVVTLVARHGHVAQLSAVGCQDREAGTPMRPDTIFQIMSVSKPISCVGFMILVDESRVSLIDPVEKYLPEFKGQMMTNSTTGGLVKPPRPITILDLLTHTSGMAGSPPKGFNRREHTLAEGVAAAAAQPLEFEPGARWHYCSMGIATLGRIIEVQTGEPFERYMEERVFAPLGMKDTSYFLPPDKESRLAAVYTDVNGKLERDKGDRFRRGAKSPAPDAGLYSTAADVAKFLQMMANEGSLNGRRILSPAAVELMTTVQTGNLKTGFAPGLGYGLGWAVVKEPLGMFRYNSIGAYGHGGAYRTYGWVDPAKDMVGVILLQRTNGGGDVADELNSFMVLCGASIEK